MKVVKLEIDDLRYTNIKKLADTEYMSMVGYCQRAVDQYVQSACKEPAAAPGKTFAGLVTPEEPAAPAFNPFSLLKDSRTSLPPLNVTALPTNKRED
jgi:hypothetical protein